jgi:hypothetical protein
VYKCCNGAKYFDSFNGASSRETDDLVEKSKRVAPKYTYTLSFVDCYYEIINFKFHGMSNLTTLVILLLFYEILRCIIIIIIIILGISFMPGIYTHIPETNHVPREHRVATILM